MPPPLDVLHIYDQFRHVFALDPFAVAADKRGRNYAAYFSRPDANGSAHAEARLLQCFEEPPRAAEVGA